MTNLKGPRIEVSGNAGSFNLADARLNISADALVAPFRITARCRIFSAVVNFFAGIKIIYGGASDNLEQLAVIHSDGGSEFVNAAIDTVYPSDPDSAANWTRDSIVMNFESWIWLELEVDSSRNVIAKYLDDATTTRPTSFTDSANAGQCNATPSQVVQSIRFFAQMDNDASKRVILEVDEIYQTQD